MRICDEKAENETKKTRIVRHFLAEKKKKPEREDFPDPVDIFKACILERVVPVKRLERHVIIIISIIH